MSASDGAIWALVTGAFALGVVCGTVAWWLLTRQRGMARDSANSELRDDWTEHRPFDGTLTRTVDPLPAANPSPVDGDRLPLALQALILTAVGEALPAGSAALIQTPATRSSSMVWHVHVDPMVALDVRDGRTIPVAAPASTHQWTLPRGQILDVAQGGPDHHPTSEAVAMRVVGAYVRITLNGDVRGWRSVTASAHADPHGTSDLTADVASWPAVEAALRQAIALAVGRRLDASPPALGYGRAAWESHQRVWLFTSRRVGSGPADE